MKIKLLNDTPTPTYAKPGDAGLDLVSSIDVTIYPNEVQKIGTGIKCAIPTGHVGLLLPRSGLGSRGMTLANTVGVIDSSYRGEIIAMCRNTGDDAIEIKKGDRFVQLLIMPVVQVEFEQVDELDETERGEGGFGHSGT